MKRTEIIKWLRFILLILFIASFIMAISACDIIKAIASDQKENGEEDSSQNGSVNVAQGENENDKEGKGSKDVPSVNNYAVVYFEITSSEKSRHFEHRVANIYSVKPDGTEKTLIYSDINEKYDLGPLFSVSPDGSKVLGMLNEGGRGLYSALVVIDISDGSLNKLVEFDYTDNEESGEVELGIYGEPVWSDDSSQVAFEMISYPYDSLSSGRFRDAGIFIVEVESGSIREVEVDAGGASARSTTFLYPVLFSEDGEYIYAVMHPYFEKIEDGDVTGFYTKNDTLYSINLSGGQPVRILGTGDFVFPEGPEIIQSFDSFELLRSENKIIFHVLGDFEEDGDIWSCNYDGSEPAKLTTDNQLREQQPDVFEATGENGSQNNSFIAYIGSGRYGTISSEIPSGDVYISETGDSSISKLTDFNHVGASQPIISPDGNFIAFLYSEYDENYTYIEENSVRIYSLSDGSIAESLPGEAGSYGFIFNIAGWINKG